MITTVSKPCLAILLASLALHVGCSKSDDPYKALLKQMAGKWDRVNYETYLTITPDGEVEERVDGNAKPDLWYWGQLKLKTPGVMIITHNDHRKTEYRMAGHDFIAVREWNPEGIQTHAGYVLERIK